MASSSPSSLPLATPEQLRRLSAALSAPAGASSDLPVLLTPAQLRRKAANKASAHRIRAAHQLSAAAAASSVAAAAGTGEDRSLLAAATQDLAALQLVYRTRTATGAITGVNPYTGATGIKAESAHSVCSSRVTESLSMMSPGGSSTASAAGNCAAREGPTLDEEVLWIYENL